MKNIAELFTDDALNALKEQVGIVLSNDYDYSEDQLGEIYEKITAEFPYEFDSNGEPQRLGYIFESILNVFIQNKLIKFND